MYKKEFDAHLEKGTFSNAIILFGESHFFIDQYTNILSNDEGASKLSFYHDEYSFDSAFAHLSQGSLFGDANILIIKSEKKLPKNDLEKFLEACSKNPGNRFIYAYYGNDYKTCDKAFNAKSGGMSVRFFSPNTGESIAFLVQEAQKHGIKIDRYALSHLLQTQSNNLSLAVSELEKLSLYDKEITTKEIDELVYGLSSISTDDLIQRVLFKQEFRSELQKILQHGEDEIKILTTFSAFVTQLYLFNIYIRINGAPDSMAILGYNLPAFVLKERANFSLKFKPATYKNLLDLLLSAELKLKSSGIDKEAILFATLLRVQKII